MRYVGLLLGLLLVAYLATGVTQIQSNERAVVRRFGRPLDDQPGPGLHIGLPWGMDRVDRVEVDKVRHVEIGFQPDADDTGVGTPQGQFLTGDRNLVNVQVTIHYAVDGEHLEDYVIQADRADSLIARTAESILAEWVAGRNVDAVLIRRADLDLVKDSGALRQRLVEAVQQRLEPYRIGVRIQEASIKEVAPPEEVKDAFDNVTRAQTEIRTLKNQALQYAEQQRQETRAEVKKRHDEGAVYVRDQLRKGELDRDTFIAHLAALRQPGRDRLAYFRQIWWLEVGKPLLVQMAEAGRIEDLNQFMTRNGLDLTYFMNARPAKKP